MRLAAIVLAAALVALPRTARAQASPAPADSAAAAAAPNAIPTIDEGQLPVPLRPASRMETQNLIRRYYPASLLRTGGEGEAGVRVVVDEDGKVATAEVERYFVDPGQALAYKTGQLEILALRDEGKKRLGSRFDIKAFHDVVLKNGAVSLTTLREQVEKYYASVEGSAKAK